MSSYIETFDRNALETILANREYFEGIIRPDGPKSDEKYSPFEICQKYLNKAIGKNGDIVEVKYSYKNGRGRRFANGALSLQSMPKLIRGTISHKYYYDIDMVNAHPTIIKEICYRKGISMIFLSAYITDRDHIINEIIELNNELDYSFVKNSILSVIYGGFINVSKIKNKTEWMIGFMKEISLLHNKVREWFPEEYKLQVELKGVNYHNLIGSTLSASICVEEDLLLEKMVNYLKTKKLITNNAVLTFDGIMVPRKSIKNSKVLDTTLREIEQIFKDSGYDIKLKIKDFEILDLNIKENQHNTLSRPEVVDYKKLYLESDYYWFDFMEDMVKIHSNFKVLCDTFTENINKVMFRIYDMEKCYVRKISKDDMFNVSDLSLKEVFSYRDVNHKGDPIISTISMKKIMDSIGLISAVKCYNKLDFKPLGAFEKETDLEYNDTRNFNTWTNFKAKLLPKEEVDDEIIEPILNHIKKVWCDDNEDIYKYILSWFKVIFTKPSFKSKVVIVLKSSEKQIGKGILISNFLIPYVFGKQYAITFAGLDTITTRFNEIMMNKILINCDELSTLEAGFHQSFNVLKHRITDNTIKIEIKNGKAFIYPDFSNYIMCTNHDFTINLEMGDARYLMLECSPIFKGKFEYFNKLYETFNQTTADHFYSYICHLENTVEIRNIPTTDLKKDIIIMGLQSPLKFLLELHEYIQDDISSNSEFDGDVIIYMNVRMDKTKTKATDLYKCYVNWCAEQNEKVLSNAKFGREIKKYVVKRKMSCYVYDLTTINIKI